MTVDCLLGSSTHAFKIQSHKNPKKPCTNITKTSFSWLVSFRVIILARKAQIFMILNI